MGSAVQSSPLTSTLTMRAFLTVFLAVAVCGEADPYTIGQVLIGRTAGGVITGVTYPGVGTVAGFPYTAVHHPFYYGKREAEAEPYTVGQIAAGHHIANAVAEGRPHNVGVITNAAIAPVVHHGVVGYAGYHPYVYGKREAEAEPYYGYTAGVYPSVYHAVSTTVLSDMPDIILMSMARGRLRPSPSTVTPPELSLTCTTLLLSLLLLSDTLSP